MLLPTVMEFNRMVRRERFSQIGRALTGKKTDDREAIAAVRELIAEVGLSKRLSDAGAMAEHFSAWAQAAQEDICRAFSASLVKALRAPAASSKRGLWRWGRWAWRWSG